MRATLRDVATGRERHVRARYLIAADGAHSRVRAELGIPATGLDGLGEAVSAVFAAPIWPLLGEHRYGIYDINHPDARGVLLPAGRNDRWLYGVVGRPGEDAAAAATPNGSRAGSGGRSAPPTCRSRSSAPGASGSPPSWPTGSGRGTHSWSATPPTGSPPAAGPA